VGAKVGPLVGRKVGAVGSAEGTTVGAAVGSAVGFGLGIPVGVAVGALVGRTVGKALGIVEGNTVGVAIAVMTCSATLMMMRNRHTGCRHINLDNCIQDKHSEATKWNKYSIFSRQHSIQSTHTQGFHNFGMEARDF
jgi:hypothetical protein